MATDPESTSRLRELPSVEELASRLEGVSHGLAVSAAREAIEARRVALMGAGAGDASSAAEGLEADARARAEAATRPSLRPLLNATGVIVHTNLGRAPLPWRAIEHAAAVAEGYSNLEYELEEGGRGSRHAHVEELLRKLTGAEAALVVNNCAAAALLACAALAASRELVVSRGQLIEIGGSFRVPEVVAQSGARLVEVGTTNRTRLSDYQAVLGADTGAVMRAHPSNFRVLGFTEDVAIEDLCGAAAAAGVPVIDDVGSGVLVDGVPELADEPPVRRSVAAGADVVCFSGDKLLGGPQAGLMVGRSDAVDRCRRHPLARALRVDKMSLAALEVTLRTYLDPKEALREIPVLRMLMTPDAELRTRAERMRARLLWSGSSANVIPASGRVGGGALPLLELEGPVCAIDPGPMGLDALAARLRAGDPPVIARAGEGWLLLDPRTLTDGEAERAAEAVAAALA